MRTCLLTRSILIVCLAPGIAATASELRTAATKSKPAGAHRVRVPAATADRVESVARTDYGAFVWLTLDDAQYAALQAAGIEHQDDVDGFTLRLGEQSFDPLVAAPALAPNLAAARSDGPDLRLVQFDGPTKSEWLDGLRADGLEIVQYIHPHSYIVWGTRTQCDTARRRPRVRWTGDFAPAYRLLPRYRAARAGRDTARALIYRGADVADVQRRIVALGGKATDVRVLNDTFALVAFEIGTDHFADVAALPGVYSVKSIPRDGGLRGEMSDQVNVNNVDGTNLAFPGYQAWLATVGLSGAGVIIANVDGGIADTHADLVNRMLSCSGTTCGGAATDSHGTHTAGIMAADGSSGVTDSFGFLRGLGMAPGANLVEQVYSPYYSQAGGMLLLMKDSYNNGASLSGNSWGPAGTPHGYDDDTMQVDIGVRDAVNTTAGNQPLSFVLSFMNGYGGTSSQGTPDEAKNIFTVGSTKMQNSGGSQILQIDDVSANSAHGPALDGRTIPHIVAPGCSVDSTVPGGHQVSGFCGTSMASPHVSGAVALFIEYYRNLPGYTADPSPALIKAAFIAVARDLAGHLDADGGTLGHPFDSKQGWGRMDAEAVLDPPLPVLFFDNPQIFDNTGEEWVTAVEADDPLEPMRLMLVWTDAPGHGLGGSTPAWNNDLDLVVESGANTYRGNVFGGNGYSTTGGTADNKNNTEGVFLLAPGAGSITVRVVASSINSDAIPGSGDTTDQDFALACYNCAADAGFTLSAEPDAIELCAPADAEYLIDVGSVLGYSDPVTLTALNLPAGASADFSVNPVNPPGSSTLTVSNTAAVAPGSYDFDVQGQDAGATITHLAALSLDVFDAAPGAVTLDAPINGATGVSVAPTLSWAPSAQAQSYTVEVATDVGFANIVYSETTESTSTVPAPALATLTTYHWRVAAENACGQGAYSAVHSFTTSGPPRILLVDDDDNSPNVRPLYTIALDDIDVDYDIWDTAGGTNEPPVATLDQYVMVIWFSGDLFDPGGGLAGPNAASEDALGSFLDAGGCFFISSQDYHYDRGTTAFMTDYLGVNSVLDDTNQATATGAGALFTGYGPVGLIYPFDNFSDTVQPAAGAAVAFVGDEGNMAITKDNGTYRSSYWGFPFEAIPSFGDRANLMNAMVNWCGAGPPPPPGDYDGDGDVDIADASHWDDCMTGPNNGPYDSGCESFDFDGDTDVDTEDWAAFELVFGSGN